MNDHLLLEKAITQARASVARGGFPAGAVVVLNGEVIGEGLSIGNVLHDPTAHGEVAAIRDACIRLNTDNLRGATLNTSLQPCLMCFGAALWGGITRIVFACSKERVSTEYYGEHTNMKDVNSAATHPVSLIHHSALERESLVVIQEWEKHR